MQTCNHPTPTKQHTLFVPRLGPAPTPIPAVYNYANMQPYQTTHFIFLGPTPTTCNHETTTHLILPPYSPTLCINPPFGPSLATPSFNPHYVSTLLCPQQVRCWMLDMSGRRDYPHLVRSKLTHTLYPPSQIPSPPISPPPHPTLPPTSTYIPPSPPRPVHNYILPSAST